MSFADRLRFLLVTGCGLGLAPVASGTFGTLAGVAAAVVLQCLFEGFALVSSLFTLAFLLLVIGCSMTSFSRRMFHTEDPKAFVLDEIVGYLLAVALVAMFRGTLAPSAHVLAFFAFRVFDILKVPPALQAENLPGAFGIMLDDVVAGLYAGAAVVLLMVVGLA